MNGSWDQQERLTGLRVYKQLTALTIFLGTYPILIKHFLLNMWRTLFAFTKEKGHIFLCVVACFCILWWGRGCSQHAAMRPKTFYTSWLIQVRGVYPAVQLFLSPIKKQSPKPSKIVWPDQSDVTAESPLRYQIGNYHWKFRLLMCCSKY